MDTVFHHEVDLARLPLVAQATRPWGLWELDEEFFEALSQWTLENPETTLDRVLDLIWHGLQNSKDLFRLIPEISFPAHSLIIALAHLLKLGISIHAQRNVYGFVKDVARRFELVRLALGSAKHGKFPPQAWQDLRNMRDVVDILCLWAVKRLKDGRWLCVEHKGIAIRTEAGEFKERVDSARALFQNSSAIRNKTGLAAIFHNSRNMTTEMLRKTDQMHLNWMTHHLKFRNQDTGRSRFFASTLGLYEIANPTYDRQGKQPCDDGTRVEVLEKIRKWRDDVTPGAPNFLWLTGYPGCGKSAVAASFTRECKDAGFLWAQLFLNRNNAETVDPRSYFPSIARQLANYSEEVAETIHLTLAQRTSLMDDISVNQAGFLFILSIRKAAKLHPDRPIVVVIDGLDETNRSRLEDTAKIFSMLFPSLAAFSNVKVLISSRTENEIYKSFSLPPNVKHVKRMHLDIADPSSVRDVSHYLKRSLLNLVETYGLDWDVWPGDELTQALGKRASGLFVCAAAAIKSIQGGIGSIGTEYLNDSFNMLTSETLHDINALYTLILTLTYGFCQDEWEFETFRRIVGAIACLQDPLSLDDLAILLDLRSSPSSEPVNLVQVAARRFRTILEVNGDAIDGTTVPRIHRSVREFITSDSVDTQFHVEPNYTHLELALQCFGTLSHFGVVQEFDEEVLPALIRYACRSWFSHFSQVIFPDFVPLCVDYRTPSDTPLRAPFAHSLHSSPDWSRREPLQIHYSASNSQIHIKVKVHNCFGIWDTTSGLIKTHMSVIHGIVPSWNDGSVLTCSEDGTIRIWDSENLEFRRTLVQYYSAFYSVAISPNGRLVASASSNCMVCLWDYATGALIWESPQEIHFGPSVVAFSRNGEWVISGWKDGSMRLLDGQTGKMVGDDWIGHKAHITSIEFSASDQRVCSVDVRGSCFIWDTGTGQRIDSWTCSDGQHPHLYCTFSPQDDDVIVVYGDFGIEIRSHEHRWLTSSRGTRCLAFSPDGKEIIFGDDCTFSVAEIGEDGQMARIIRHGDTILGNTDALLAFSPNWAFAYFCPYGDNHLQVLALHHSETALTMLPAEEELHLFDENQHVPSISGVEEITSSLYTFTNNQRLDTVTWYKVIGGAETEHVKLCMLTDDAIVIGYGNGSVTVWSLGN